MKLLRDATAGRLLVGLGLGLLVGLALVHSAAESAHWVEDRAAADRAARAEVAALAEVLDSAGGAGDAAPGVVGQWLARGSALREVRVVNLAERSLAASSVETEKAPRRLEREEKPLFDLAQTLRAAIEENREAGHGVKEEIAVERLPGAVRIAVPLLVGADFAGFVQATAAQPSTGKPLPWGRPLGLAGVALLVFFALSRWIPRRTATLSGLAAALLVVVLATHGALAWRELAVRQAAGEASTATALEAIGRRVAATTTAAVGDPARWDVDVFRQPRAAIAAGQVDAAKLEARRVGLISKGRQRVALSAALALLLASFVGLGGAALLWATLKRYRVAYAYSLPALFGMAFLVFLPFLYGLALSFTNANIYNSDKPLHEIWVGLDNFQEILGDFDLVEKSDQGSSINYRNFYYTLFFTGIWTVSNVTIGVSLGLVLALILNTKGLRGKAIYRVMFILPWAVPNYITALIWKGMFHQQFGVINQVLQIFGLDAVSWFERPVTSFATVLTTNGWLSFPFMMVISLGALQSIPADLYEAARVDGATRWQQFRSITLPSLKPALVPAVILSVIWTFNMFNIIYLVSQGEPGGATEILVTQAYKLAFEQYRYGYAAAYSTVIFLILLAYGTWQNRVTKASEGI
jgi:arabinogalactan oligomer/maltooligosaccharide transport system permease protein